MPTIALAGDGPDAAIFEAAARRLGWELVEGDGAGADIVVVATSAQSRADDAAALLARGTHVIVSPGMSVGDAERLVDAQRRSSAVLLVAEILPTAPAVQRWFGELGRLDGTAHLSGRSSGTGLDRSLLALTVLSARLAGWGDPVDAVVDGRQTSLRFTSPVHAARLTDDGDHSRPQLELQAASASGALRLEMFPQPGLERDGAPLALPATREPDEMFGATPLLRTFWADIEAGRQPVLGAAFALAVERVRALSRGR